MSDFKPTEYEKELIEKWNSFTQNYCVTIPTVARMYGYMNSTKINMFLQGKCALSSQTIGRIEHGIQYVISKKQ
jgi:hypothetical protein